MSNFSFRPAHIPPFSSLLYFPSSSSSSPLSPSHSLPLLILPFPPSQLTLPPPTPPSLPPRPPPPLNPSNSGVSCTTRNLRRNRSWLLVHDPELRLADDQILLIVFSTE